MFSVYSHLIVIVIMLINVAFVTLFERKVLGYSQYRKGPNKVSMMGVLQPISDALKLFFKEITIPFKGNKIMFFVSPMFAISLSMLVWGVSPYAENLVSFKFSVITLIVLLSFGVYPLLMIGWSSNSKYAMLGVLRGVAQTISYEISLALMLMMVIVMVSEMSVSSVSFVNKDQWLFLLCPSVMVLWLLSCVAETNRSPFDFSEGESELVSGFNVEFGAMGFTFIFMAEYSMILFFSFLTSLIFIFWSASNFFSSIGMLLFVMMWMWLRATFPRYRYDKLMGLAWKSILPIVLVMLMWAVILSTL